MREKNAKRLSRPVAADAVMEVMRRRNAPIIGEAIDVPGFSMYSIRRALSYLARVGELFYSGKDVYRLPDVVANTLTQKRASAWRVISVAGRPVVASDLVQHSGLTRAQAMKYLTELVAAGYLRRANPGQTPGKYSRLIDSVEPPDLVQIRQERRNHLQEIVALADQSMQVAGKLRMKAAEMMTEEKGGDKSPHSKGGRR